MHRYNCGQHKRKGDPNGNASGRRGLGRLIGTPFQGVSLLLGLVDYLP